MGTNTIDKHEIWKYKTEHEKIRTMCSYIGATSNLIQAILDQISSRIEEEVKLTKENAEKNNENLTDFQEEMWCWEDSFKNIRLALRGIGRESDEVESKLLSILHFIREEADINLIY